MTINYVFWDSDNTLVKTFEHHWNKHFEVLKTYGIHLDDTWKERIYTNNGNQNWEWLTGELGLKAPRDEYIDAIDSWYHRHIPAIEIREGVVEALEMMKEKGLPMAVVSNGRIRSVTPALEAKGLSPYFKFILCKEDYAGRKPDPAPYLAALTKMRQVTGQAIGAGECLVIEDDPKGVESGRAAGMHVLDRPLDDQDTARFIERCASFLAP
ncbi:MAG: HAD family phosphatase [Micavibrio sp.]